MQSCLYIGQVAHRRLAPVLHRFRYSLYMLQVDLAELPTLLKPGGLLRSSPFAPASFCRADHLGDPFEPLDESVRQAVEFASGSRPRGPIRLLTALRCWGYYFSPLNLYYCYDESGRSIEAVLAQVSNTPWLETHQYVLCDQNLTSRRLDGRLSYLHEKTFHVSPFMDLNYQYRWRLSPPGERLGVSIRNLRDGQPCFDATMRLHRRELTRANWRQTLLRHPWMSGQVTAAIYYQAYKLWSRGCRYFPHPKRLNSPPSQQASSPPTSTFGGSPWQAKPTATLPKVAG